MFLNHRERANLLTDVVGSTELSQCLSAEAADEVCREHFSIGVGRPRWRGVRRSFRRAAPFAIYLCTRTVELVVHTVDICDACSMATDSPELAARITRAVMAETARHRGW